MFVGGNKKQKGPSDHGTGPRATTAVIGAVERKGNVATLVIRNTDAPNCIGFKRKVVSTKFSVISTNEARQYGQLRRD